MTKTRPTAHTLLIISLAASQILGVSASEQTITLRDWTGRGFAPEVISYDVDSAGAKNLRVTGPDGSPLPVQIMPGVTKDRSILLFPADLPKDATMTFKVGDTGNPGPPEASIKQDGESLVLSNALLSIRIPKVQQRRNVAVKDLPAPIMAFQSAGGPWRGAGRMTGDGKVDAFRVIQVAAGPVRAEARYEMDYASGGTYRCTVRVDAREPIAEVTEEYDLKGAPQKSTWELDLAAGWQPQQAEWIRPMGNGGYEVENKPLAEFAGKDVKAGGGGYGTGGTSKQPGEAKSDGRHVCRLLAPDSNWSGDQANYIGLSADKNLAGVVLLHKGSWRRPNNLTVFSGGSELAVSFPIGCQQLSWLNEITSEISPFSMHEHDPNMPSTFGRRVWGLQLAAIDREPKGSRHGDGVFFRGRVFYGTIGLDRYKDFILSWDDKKVSYPRLFLRPDEIEKMRKEWKNSPVAEGLAKLYMVTGDESVAKSELANLKRHLSESISYVVCTPTMGHHHNYNWLWVMADDLLSWPGLPAEERTMIRARLALAAYLYADADVTSKGSGTHHGNPNMGVARQFADAALLPALLPDHPMNKAWTDYWAEWCDYKMGHMTSAGGDWFEHGSAYQMHAFSKVNRAMAAWETSKPAKLEVFRKRFSSTWQATLDQTTPFDPRVGSRLFMGIHNSPPGFEFEALEGVGTLAPSKPDLAANLKWLWQATGADNKNYSENFHPIYDRPWVAAKEPALGSQIYPGLGIVFRAHQGADESWMFLRGGYHWSHAYPDEGNFNFVSRGSIIVPWQPYQYYWAEDKSFSLFNTVRLGDPKNEQPFAWPDQNVIEHAFTPTTDYARVSIGFPSWYINPAVQPGFGDPLPLAPGLNQKEGAVRHDRQVVFVKGRTPSSPTYAIFRDTFTGPGRLASWLNLNLLGRKGDIQPKGKKITAATEFPMQLDLQFLQDSQPALEMKEDDMFLAVASPPFGAEVLKRLMGGKSPSPNWIRKDGKPAAFAEGSLPDVERHVLLRLAGKPGDEFHWVIFPRAKNEAAPQIERPAPGVAKVTHSDGTDWVFSAPDRIEWSGGGVVFKGTAGIVRLAKDGSVTLQILAGTGDVSYKGAGISGPAPLTRTLAAGASTPNMTVVEGAKFSISYDVLNPLDGSKEHIAREVYNHYTRENVTITGGRGAVRILNDGKLRFSTPDATFVEMTCGTIGIRGMGPFDLTYSPGGWSGTVDGLRRTLVMSSPEKMSRPMLLLDGQVWASGIPDEPSPWRGRNELQFGLAAGVDSGKQELEIVEWEWPSLPPVPVRAKLH